MLHIPVLAKEVVTLIQPSSVTTILDLTLGHAGHTLLLLEKGANVIGMDYDPLSLRLATNRIKEAGYSNTFTAIQDNFANFDKYVVPAVNVIFADLGINTSQILDQNNGISFKDQTLSMKLDPNSDSPTAEEIVNTYSVEHIQQILENTVQEKLSRQIAQAIVNYRTKVKRIQTATELAEIVSQTYSTFHIKPKHHPATKTFLALRMMVNNEIENLKTALEKSLLFPKIKYVWITFHSTEDRIVKLFIIKNKFRNTGIIKPSSSEISTNPLSRSAVLRWYETS